MVEVTVAAEVDLDDDLIDLLRAAIRATAQQSIAAAATVDLLLTDDATLHRLNREYRQIDKPTDVLSFEDGEAPYPGAPIHLGDIAVSLPQAERQAQAGGHAFSAELQLLVVHGTLHLLGHDHADQQEKTRMWQAQADILRRLDAPITGPPEIE